MVISSSQKMQTDKKNLLTLSALWWFSTWKSGRAGAGSKVFLLQTLSLVGEQVQRQVQGSGEKWPQQRDDAGGKLFKSSRLVKRFQWQVARPDNASDAFLSIFQTCQTDWQGFYGNLEGEKREEGEEGDED